MKSVLILMTSFLILFQSYSQVSQLWTKRYNGTGNSYDEATSVWIDNSGNIYIAGGSTGSGSGLDFTVIKYNSLGDVIWTARYNGPGNGFDDAYSVKCDNQGNVYVSGSSEGAGSGLDYCVVKYNPSGVQQWVYRYNGPGNLTDEVYSIQIDNSGNVYITGYSNGGSTMDDICTIKLN
ncbi:MAG: SBBP repeat-containing protein, partial [Ignavibacteria bacterium]|nr:SBBP repeat-containing protein [Ignavibacteria bacterium]